jgi:RNA polymerase sigma factor (sigma-70 family)
VDAALRDLDRVPLPEAILDTEEMRRRVAEALSRIGKDHSDVLILRYFHGLGVGEIAARRGLSREAVESRLVRAREALHEFLGGHACAALFLSETSSS